MNFGVHHLSSMYVQHVCIYYQSVIDHQPSAHHVYHLVSLISACTYTRIHHQSTVYLFHHSSSICRSMYPCIYVPISVLISYMKYLKAQPNFHIYLLCCEAFHSFLHSTEHGGLSRIYSVGP